MGNLANTVGFTEGGGTSITSRGGKRYRRLFGTVTFSSSYATGGDSVQVPSGYGTLVAVNVLCWNVGTVAAPKIVQWDGSTSTPKLRLSTAYAGTEAANASDNSAVSVPVELVFAQG